jgi:hypothetical protein
MTCLTSESACRAQEEPSLYSHTQTATRAAASHYDGYNQTLPQSPTKTPIPLQFLIKIICFIYRLHETSTKCVNDREEERLREERATNPPCESPKVILNRQ